MIHGLPLPLADLCFLVAGVIGKGLSVPRRVVSPWFALVLDCCGRRNGGLRSKDNGAIVEVPCFRAKRGLGLYWLSLITIW